MIRWDIWCETCAPTWYVIVRGLYPCWEVGVFRYGVGVVVQRRQLRQDLCVSWHEDGRKNYRRDVQNREDWMNTWFKFHTLGSVQNLSWQLRCQFPHLASPPAGSGRGWCRLHPSWGWRRTRRSRWRAARGGCAGRAIATGGSRWHEADLYGETLADARPEIWPEHPQREDERNGREGSVPNDQRKTCMDGGKREGGAIRQQIMTKMQG